MKTCNTCGNEYAKVEFCNHSTNKDKLNNQCRYCVSAYNKFKNDRCFRTARSLSLKYLKGREKAPFKGNYVIPITNRRIYDHDHESKYLELDYIGLPFKVRRVDGRAIYVEDVVDGKIINREFPRKQFFFYVTKAGKRQWN